jgi:integrase
VVTHSHCHVAERDVDPDPAFSGQNVHTVEPARMPANGRAWLRPSDPGAPTGFRLMVTASGYRAYYLIYRPRNGDKSRACRIGTTEDLSYREAKTKAEAIRGIVAGGKDPVADEQAARERKRPSRVVTVRDVFDYFLEVHRTKLDHKTILGYEETRDVFPRSFLDEPAENVTPAMFRKLISDKTKAPVMQNRHLSRLKAAVRFARSESYIGRLPAIVEMKKPHTERKRKRVLTSEEIRAMWESLETIAPTLPRGGRAFLASVRIALLVGTRLGETSDAGWAEFDLDGAKPQSLAVPEGQPTWYIPAEHRKGPRGKKVAHWIPLPPLAVSVLRDLEPVTRDKPRVFHKAGYDARTYMLAKLLAEMRRRGFGEHFSFHDLRRTCSTGLGELGCPRRVERPHPRPRQAGSARPLRLLEAHPGEGRLAAPVGRSRRRMRRSGRVHDSRCRAAFPPLRDTRGVAGAEGRQGTCERAPVPGRLHRCRSGTQGRGDGAPRAKAGVGVEPAAAITVEGVGPHPIWKSGMEKPDKGTDANTGAIIITLR